MSDAVSLVNMEGKTDPILEYERLRSGVGVDSLTRLLDGSDTASRRRRYLISIVENDPTFSNKDNPYMSRLERMESALKKAAKLHVLRQKGGILHGIGYEVNKVVEKRMQGCVKLEMLIHSVQEKEILFEKVL